MAFLEYQLADYRKMSWIRESNEKVQWFFRKQKQSSSVTSLEEEIYALRRRLEHLVREDTDLSSPEIVEISMQLDEKINEYMNRGKGDL
ncbi:aspartyl-phosphate phosphatase Spo0E family protein [Paenibacillus hamazuiensis]|uniref:aspartyl-phosphate phosphatase Spo0E family protein n=1 Tax=Paenibacillus hamazuiensis TaxID=2936508 RepID=UPI00200FA1C1|nr:aspartyl-phosphate phosphatase Spo0E family protein [Paenibacillus hamazuiensis]